MGSQGPPLGPPGGQWVPKGQPRVLQGGQWVLKGHGSKSAVQIGAKTTQDPSKSSMSLGGCMSL